MKKKFSLGVLIVLTSLSILISPAQAAQGNWSSAWAYDLNGVSSVGTTNAYTSAGWFQLRVVRGGGAHVGNYSVQLSPHQSASQNFWGAIGDKQGQVLCSPQYFHVPHFNS